MQMLKNLRQILSHGRKASMGNILEKTNKKKTFERISVWNTKSLKKNI